MIQNVEKKNQIDNCQMIAGDGREKKIIILNLKKGEGAYK
jgi:hypothetical protein